MARSRGRSILAEVFLFVHYAWISKVFRAIAVPFGTESLARAQYGLGGGFEPLFPSDVPVALFENSGFELSRLAKNAHEL